MVLWLQSVWKPLSVLCTVVVVVAATSYAFSRVSIANAYAQGAAKAAAAKSEQQQKQQREQRTMLIESALAEVEQKLALYPNNDTLLVHAANLAYDKQDFKRARRYYEQYVTHVSATNDLLNIDYAYSLFATGESAKGINLLETLLTRSPSNQTAMFNLAIMHVQLGNLPECKRWIQRCAAVNASTAVGKRALAMMNELQQ
jgi:tetratricopeptide (TPR) repeat protein